MPAPHGPLRAARRRRRSPWSATVGTGACALALPFVVGGCGPGGRSLFVGIADDGALLVTLDAPDGTRFGAVSAVADGVGLDGPTFTAGSPGKLFDAAASPATARFRLPAARRPPGAALHVEVREDDARFTFDAPDMLAPRNLTTTSALDRPLGSGDTIALTWQPAADALSTSAGLGNCAYAGVHHDTGGAIRLVVPDLRTAWACAARPPGSTFATTLAITVVPIPRGFTCGGVESCGVTLPMVHVDLPVTLQF